ncbi:MAG TPA: O-antigen ligase family protein [Bryobacteraceae bacterium]|nr:O-antigen ligase family protein [Bryobacteraceae bacterium]
MRAFCLSALSLVVAYAAVRHGGVDAEVLWPCLLAVALLVAVYWLRARSLAPAPGRDLRWLLFALPALFALQLVPLPVSAVRWISPARFALEQAAAPVVGSARAVALSVAPAATLVSVAILAACVLVLLLVRELAWRWDARPWLPAVPLILLAVFEAGLALAQPEARGTFVNRNHFASLLAAVLPFPVAWGLALLGRHLRRSEIAAAPVAGACALFSATALLAAAVVRSSSRMGFLAALLALAVTAAAVARGRRAALAAALLGTAAFLLLPTDALIGRYAELASDDVSAGTRLRLWRETVPLVRDYALPGCGLGAYGSVFPRYKTAVPLHTVEFAHNDYLQLAAEGGLAGFVPFALAVFLIIAGAARATGATGTRDRRCRAAACLAALTALLFHAVFDFGLHIPVNALAAAWIAGLATTPDPGPPATAP